MVKFEYAVFDANKHYYYHNENREYVSFRGFVTEHNITEKIVTFLNERGTEGWELVSVKDNKYYFKREITGVRLEKLNAEQEAEEKSIEERKTKMTELERAYQLVENTPQLKGSSKSYGYIGELKREEITFEEFKVKIDELIEQKG